MVGKATKTSVKVVEVNLLPLTTSKQQFLTEFNEEYNRIVKELQDIAKFGRGYIDSSTKLHHLTYKTTRKESFLPAQLVESSRIDAWNNRKNGSVRDIGIRLTLRDFRYTSTERGNPIVIFKKRGLPIKQDGAFQRFNSFLCNAWVFASSRIIKRKHGFVIQFTLKKQFSIPKLKTQTVIGVDVGSATLAAITIRNKNKVLKQTYFGRDLWNKQRNFALRRTKLQSLADKGSHKAIQSLRKLKRDERNFIKNRSYEVAWKIVHLAKEHNASIAVENLKHLGRNRLNTNANRKVHHIPYFKFFTALEDICLREGIVFEKINPRYTSQTCSKCGHISRSNRKGVTFKCVKCGFTANADRVASFNIAGRASANKPTNLVFAQSSAGRMPVNASLRSDDGRVLVSHA